MGIKSFEKESLSAAAAAAAGTRCQPRFLSMEFVY